MVEVRGAHGCPPRTRCCSTALTVLLCCVVLCCVVLCCVVLCCVRVNAPPPRPWLLYHSYSHSRTALLQMFGP